MSFLCSDCALMAGGVPCPRCFSIHTSFRVQGGQNDPGRNLADGQEGQHLEAPSESFIPRDIDGVDNGQFSKNSVTDPAKGMAAPFLPEHNQVQSPNKELAVPSRRFPSASNPKLLANRITTQAPPRGLRKGLQRFLQ
ncbi:hypothetical protein TWF192_005247 [Orbilia oligospora]|uniref:Uncharacterized protein n=1 Tax=Orbilia oligospora TaxID=2813651 RepID=A0A6G1M990_ORBOL|nr:hypothetical protein TWF191_008706 [Orbilia oligospora]KAF3250226.1 hypothetical protein TWF192_005247 [Orbilia oligospora]